MNERKYKQIKKVFIVSGVYSLIMLIPLYGGLSVWSRFILGIATSTFIGYWIASLYKIIKHGNVDFDFDYGLSENSIGLDNQEPIVNEVNNDDVIEQPNISEDDLLEQEIDCNINCTLSDILQNEKYMFFYNRIKKIGSCLNEHYYVQFVKSTSVGIYAIVFSSTETDVDEKRSDRASYRTLHCCASMNRKATIQNIISYIYDDHDNVTFPIKPIKTNRLSLVKEKFDVYIKDSDFKFYFSDIFLELEHRQHQKYSHQEVNNVVQNYINEVIG